MNFLSFFSSHQSHLNHTHGRAPRRRRAHPACRRRSCGGPGRGRRPRRRPRRARGGAMRKRGSSSSPSFFFFFFDADRRRAKLAPFAFAFAFDFFLGGLYWRLGCDRLMGWSTGEGALSSRRGGVELSCWLLKEESESEWERGGVKVPREEKKKKRASPRKKKKKLRPFISVVVAFRRRGIFRFHPGRHAPGSFRVTAQLVTCASHKITKSVF